MHQLFKKDNLPDAVQLCVKLWVEFRMNKINFTWHHVDTKTTISHHESKSWHWKLGSSQKTPQTSCRCRYQVRRSTESSIWSTRLLNKTSLERSTWIGNLYSMQDRSYWRTLFGLQAKFVHQIRDFEAPVKSSRSVPPSIIFLSASKRCRTCQGYIRGPLKLPEEWIPRQRYSKDSKVASKNHCDHRYHCSFYQIR